MVGAWRGRRAVVDTVHMDKLRREIKHQGSFCNCGVFGGPSGKRRLVEQAADQFVGHWVPPVGQDKRDASIVFGGAEIHGFDQKRVVFKVSVHDKNFCETVAHKFVDQIGRKLLEGSAGQIDCARKERPPAALRL